MPRIEHGDCREIIPRLVAEGVVVDSIVTDPPYHLGPQNTQEIGHPSWTPNTKKARNQTGFMGQAWDGGDIAFRPETWATIATILKPGGFMLVMGGTRTHHRLYCAIEDAGFVIQDTVCWLYGSGFPKHRTHLKPAWEPVCLAYKPGKRTLQTEHSRIPTDDALTGGAQKLWSHYRDGKEPKRALRIDDCRIGTEEHTYDLKGGENLNRLSRPNGNDSANARGLGAYGVGAKQISIGKKTVTGRWPSNVIHDGSDEVLAAFAQFGESASTPKKGTGSRKRRMGFHLTDGDSFYTDSGTPARFFYTTKATKDERGDSNHPTVKPLALLRYLIRLITPRGGIVLDPFAGTGNTGLAANAEGCDSILIEKEARYVKTMHEVLLFIDNRSILGLGARPLIKRPRGAVFAIRVRS